MKLFAPDGELEILRRQRLASVDGPVQIMLVTGRRRVGKTRLVLESLDETPALYLNLAPTTESMLCSVFAEAAKANLGLSLPEEGLDFAGLFELLVIYAKDHLYTLIIDEFQNLNQVNASCLARLQAILKEYKKEAKLNLILVGTTRDNEMGLCIPSVSEEATRIHLRPFSLSELKDLMAIHAPDCAEEDVLVLHALTGGVQYYVADMLDHGAVTKEAMIDRMLATSSIYKVEGRDLLSREFDRRAVNYIGILRAMALGATKFRDIVNMSWVQNLPAYLDRLKRAAFIERIPATELRDHHARNTRWRFKDPFLRFWFRYILPNEGMLDAGSTQRVKEQILCELPELINLSCPSGQAG